MSKVPYRLHAVLVHEGQANAGHYWAYIYDPHQRCWMKYNDISVTKSSWEELVRDSFGGYRNASAYCLMYINDKKPFLIEGTRGSSFFFPGVGFMFVSDLIFLKHFITVQEPLGVSGCAPTYVTNSSWIMF